jgi:hypothetical protein
MGRYIAVLSIFALAFSLADFAWADEEGTKKVLKEGLLGAGAGAVGGWASGAKTGDVWKGALAGAGVNIVGDALLDAISGERVESVDKVSRLDAQNAYKDGYKEGYANGYKQGYTAGFKDGVEAQKQR